MNKRLLVLAVTGAFLAGAATSVPWGPAVNDGYALLSF
jgi:hypothetical protein